jgi:hypothetical protein
MSAAAKACLGFGQQQHDVGSWYTSKDAAHAVGMKTAGSHRTQQTSDAAAAGYTSPLYYNLFILH